MKKPVLFLIISSCIVSCRDPEGSQRVLMFNGSNKAVVFLSSSDYPDTIDFTISGCGTGDIANIVEPGRSKVYGVGGKADVVWEDFLDRFPQNTMMVFVYDAEAAGSIADNRKGCDSLYKRPDLILKRFDVDMDYLISNGFNLIYP